MSPRPQVIAAIIRKDLQLLWPLALAVFVLQLVIQSTLHTSMDYAGLPTEGALMQTNPFLFWLGIATPPLLSAIFIFLAVLTDIATDIRQDWLTRPVGALEIAAAKTALVLGVVFVPVAVGNTIFALTNQIGFAEGLLPVTIVLRNCLFGILLAWLVSSALQAVLALTGLMTLMAVIMAFATAVLAAFYFAGRAYGGLPPGDPPDILLSPPMLGRVLLQLALVAAVMWPLLWLLLVRRRKTAARLLFAAMYLVGNVIPITQMKMTAPVKTVQAAQAIAHTPIREIAHE